MKLENLKYLLRYGQEKMTYRQIADALTEANQLIEKSEKMERALIDIRDWDEDLEDKWEDPGYRAIEALK